MGLTGTVTFSGGTGTKTVSVGANFTKCRVRVGGPTGGSAYTYSEGLYSGGNQYVISSTGSTVSDPQTGKIVQWKDPSTGTVVFEASLTGFPTNQVTFSVTTAPTTMPQLILELD